MDNGDIAHKSEESRRDSTQHRESPRQIAETALLASLAKSSAGVAFELGHPLDPFHPADPLGRLDLDVG